MRCENFRSESCSSRRGDASSIRAECGACTATSACYPNATDFPSEYVRDAHGHREDTVEAGSNNPSVAEMYELSATLLTGTEKPFGELVGSVVMVVNTASGCAFADETHRVLNKLYKRYFDKGLRILAFPSNDFGQEDRDGPDIFDFFGEHQSTFDLFVKTSVLAGPGQHPLFHILQNASRNRIQWNYEIFLISRNAELLAHWPSGVSLLESAQLTTLKRALAEIVHVQVDPTYQTSV